MNKRESLKKSHFMHVANFFSSSTLKIQPLMFLERKSQLKSSKLFLTFQEGQEHVLILPVITKTLR